ncbi:MAG: hypothetical protein A2140_10555 [Candidatus Muproteobacteria bacterium RBG_16_62_13]|uniref:Cation/multidrug efflux pump n=1 Tax=Candidatus Muproteobacteria bacterium RBG_16_62_13 TaxID=1817756 RepID=A0A1F6T0H5_9PROT|nr:MAG: hypothetical protein A2140_10555 [Candidatus Muproteobacteria bacterium RBG_16_62_13]
MIYRVLIVVVALLGLYLFYAGLRRLWKRRFVTGSLQGMTGLALMASAAAVFLMLLNLHTYARLTHEQPLVEMVFTKIADQHFRTEMSFAGGGVRVLELRGDEWQLDAQVLKWKGPANLFGADTLYRFDRLSGRYRDIARERGGQRTIHDLNENPGLDTWRVVRWIQRWLNWVDAVYGSGTYLPMADGARFRVSLGTQGLIARPANDAAEKAVARWR